MCDCFLCGKWGVRVLIGWLLAREGEVGGYDDLRIGVGFLIERGCLEYHRFIMGIVLFAEKVSRTFD